MEPAELNQGAELCFLTFLKFLKDKQVLSDRQFALGLSSSVESSFSSVPVPQATKEGALGIHCGAAYALTCSHWWDGKVTLSLPMFPGLHEATNSLLPRLFQAA